MECALRAGSNFHKAPVVDSGASGHFFGRDVSSCVVEVREEEREFLGVEGGISRSSKDITVELPGVETVDGSEETARLDGSFSQSVPLSLLSVNGLRLQKVTKFGGAAAAPADDVDRFSDFSFDDDGEVDTNAMGGADPVAVPSSSRARPACLREWANQQQRREGSVAQEDEGVQEAQDDGRKREKEKKEKEKRVTRLSVDKKVIDVMMAYVNPRKGHVMATEEEVRNGSHNGAMREELKSFQRNEVLKLPGRVPEGSPEGFASGEVSQLLYMMYGLKDAPRLYGQHFKRIAGECGWEEVTESVFVKKEAGSVKAVMAVHVDDLLVFSDDPVRDLEPLCKRLEMDEPEILECGGEMGYTGMEVKRTEEGFALSQKAYLESIPVQKEDLPHKFLSPELIESSAEEETDESLVSVMQKVMGVLGWVCCTTTDLAYLFSELSRYNSRPSGSKLVAALLALIRTHEKGDCLQFSGVDDPKLALFVDAAYSLSCCEGRGGFEVYLVDKKESIANMRFSNLVAWKSKRIKRKLISSTSAELCALVDGVKQSFQWKRLAEALWMKPLEVEVYTDSAPLMEQLESGQSRREPHMDGLLA
uniref:Reverse transcriptase Ty1/copia-type domain-containing protein n=1 Tax=Chromera velia CCMP2878 TaxID=1169474 RepID=A0A0G4IAG5_9ALVE|eukprot:Cvel_12483.t1-p1 / transcript=Cvel_12483.t1 / gene=Cvel_12483 / organism=Chromera_velia_CCMP2878 / gene_product=Retrovirus-related Pol polyprotein from transposon, putative / transcript_product=Retrovirus-related Pol polyprotein from transposon, putative / location=Cvel_scaffold818:50872-54531(+) / protein_length=590 / sequence_SO=supercontig / SO=protein_coding / is_pseudo=false